MKTVLLLTLGLIVALTAPRSALANPCDEALKAVTKAVVTSDTVANQGSAEEIWKKALTDHPELANSTLAKLLADAESLEMGIEGTRLRTYVEEWLKTLNLTDPFDIEEFSKIWPQMTFSQQMGFIIQLTEVILNSELMRIFDRPANLRSDMKLPEKSGLTLAQIQSFNVLWKKLPPEGMALFVFLSISDQLPSSLAVKVEQKAKEIVLRDKENGLAIAPMAVDGKNIEISETFSDMAISGIVFKKRVPVHTDLVVILEKIKSFDGNAWHQMWASYMRQRPSFTENDLLYFLKTYTHKNLYSPGTHSDVQPELKGNYAWDHELSIILDILNKLETPLSKDTFQSLFKLNYQQAGREKEQLKGTLNGDAQQAIIRLLNRKFNPLGHSYP